jgi:hypothetical protein
MQSISLSARLSSRSSFVFAHIVVLTARDSGYLVCAPLKRTMQYAPPRLTNAVVFRVSFAILRARKPSPTLPFDSFVTMKVPWPAPD